jgi:retron-type reverse transcriptase
VLNFFDSSSNFFADYWFINYYSRRVRGIAQDYAETFLIEHINQNLWQQLCSYENLFLAYKNARKHKTTKSYVLEFEKELENNLLLLRTELLLKSYRPKPLVNFTIRDPKTRKISKSDFRDRVVHHALCNIIGPIFDRTFVYDSYANRIGKGTLAAIKRFDYFKRKVSKNNTKNCFILKADIKKYFENVNHNILISIIRKRLDDENMIWLIRTILNNSSKKEKGMPLGNLTSQFFANIYLNELDQFAKHHLRAKYYIRYVDDFVIMHDDRNELERFMKKIGIFLENNLDLSLHPDKCRIINLKQGMTFLGLRIFYWHKLLKRQNMRRMKNRLVSLNGRYDKKEVIYDKVYDFLEGWQAYSRQANIYKSRSIIFKEIEILYFHEISGKEIDRLIKN